MMEQNIVVNGVVNESCSPHGGQEGKRESERVMEEGARDKIYPTRAYPSGLLQLGPSS
jgi:hypothetical protein